MTRTSSSEKGWSEGIQTALDEANKTIKGIAVLEVTDKTAKVDHIVVRLKSIELESR